MVVSKRCKICTVLDPNNIPMSGEYFGKFLPDLIIKISGVELDPRKTNGVLICQSCAIQLIHTETVVDKLRGTLQRLKKIEAKSRTPSKNSGPTHLKAADNKEDSTTMEQQQNSDEKNQNNINNKTQKKIVRRKSVFLDEKQISNNEEEANQKQSSANSDKSELFEMDAENNTNVVKTSNKANTTPKKVVKRKSIATDNKIIDNSEDNSNSEEYRKVQHEMKTNTPKKIIRRKSVFPDDKKDNNDDDERNETTSILDKLKSLEMDPQSKVKLQKPPNKTKMTTKKTVRSKSVIPDDKRFELDEDAIHIEETTNSLESNKLNPVVSRKSVVSDNKYNYVEEIKQNEQTPKFKKIMDPVEITPVKKMPTKMTKRKTATSTVESLNNPSPLKRAKKMSTSEREVSPMNCTMDEYDVNVSNNEVKIMNCIICGKVFHQKGALRIHIETSHMGERLKACPHCSSEFRSLQKYESHVFSEKCKNATHACQYPKCNKRFKSVHKMELHMHEKHLSQSEQEAQ